MAIDLFLSPYDEGQRSIRMGGGPERLVESGIVEYLQSHRHEVHVQTLESDVDVPSEITLAVDLARQLADRVGESKRSGRFPLVLAGRCMTALGVVAGLGSDRTGVVWFDSHGDFNTPETSRSGMLDGMAGGAGPVWPGPYRGSSRCRNLGTYWSAHATWTRPRRICSNARQSA